MSINNLIKSIEEKKSLDSSIDELISLISLDHSIEEEKFNHLLFLIINFIKQDDDELNKLVELLNVMIPIITYEKAIQIISFETLLQALTSQFIELQILAIKIFTKASPPDILANTEVIDKMVWLLINSDSIKLATELEKSLDILLKGELILKKLLSMEIPIEKNDSLIMSRILNLTLILLKKSKKNIEKNIIPLLNKLTSSFDDEIYLLNLIQFFIDVLMDKPWLLDLLKPFIYSLLLHVDKSDFFEGSIIELYSKISYISENFFKQIDCQFIGKTPYSSLFLSSINPKYLFKYHPLLLSKIRITFNSIPIYRNLIRDNDAFQLIKSSLNSKDILLQSYLEFIAIVESLSCYQPIFLINELPQVMNKFLNGEFVTEEECYNLRKKSLQNLLEQIDILDIWKDAVLYEWNILINGKNRKNIQQVTVNSII